MLALLLATFWNAAHGLAQAHSADISDQEKIALLRSKISDIDGQIEGVLQDAYRQDPLLLKATKAWESLRASYDNDLTQPRLDVANELHRRKAGGEPAWPEYLKLRGLWAQVVRVEHARDPVFQKLLIYSLRNADLSNSDMKDLDQSAPDDELIAQYLAIVEVRRPAALLEIRLLESKAKFPQNIREQAKEDADAQGRIALADTYVRMQTPAKINELKAARKQHEIELSRIPASRPAR